MKSTITELKKLLLIASALTLLPLVSGASEEEKSTGVVPAYLEVQQALAADNLDEAKASAEDLKGTAEEGSDVAKYAEGVAGAEDLSAARTQFKDLSAAVIEVAKGDAGEEELYLVTCPMAFDNKGGSWLQNEKDVANPYMGKKMEKCGSVKKLSAE